ncbi:PEP-utilizing enzyme [Nanoarchaeota archaeon]
MKKWTRIAEDSGDLFPVTFMYECLVERAEEVLGAKVNNWMHVGRNSIWEVAADLDNWDMVGSAAYKKLKQDKGFLKQIRENTLNGCKLMIETSEKIYKTDLSKLANKQLWDLYQEYRQKDKDMYIWGMVPVLIDFEVTRLSDEIRSIIKSKLNENEQNLLPDYFITLTTSKEDTLMKQEKLSFLNVAKEISENQEAKELFKKSVDEIKAELSNFKEIDEKIEEHTKNYCFFGYGYLGPAWKKEYYLELLSGFIKVDNPEEKIKEIEEEKQATDRKREEVIRKLKLTEDELYLMDAGAEFGFLKVNRKDLLYKSYYHMNNWLEEVSKRFGLTITQLRHMISEEVKDMILDNKLPDKNVLDQRIEFYLFILKDQKLTIHHGDEAKKLHEELMEKQEDIDLDELKGDCSCQGQARGEIKIIKTVEDMEKMNQGDILVSPATNPNLVPAMQKAGAIITDEGGITCHAAIVSRELGVPCITGTKIVTKAFKDGDLVEVDATNGIVRRVK